MKKKLSQWEHEELVLANEQIEIAAKALEFLDLRCFDSEFPKQIGTVISTHAEKIRKMLGSYHEFCGMYETGCPRAATPRQP